MKHSVQRGDLVQLCPGFADQRLACCIVTVTHVHAWGIQGYVQSLGQGHLVGNQTYTRAKWDECEYVGAAAWTVGGG
jgi:hypothetical protein